MAFTQQDLQTIDEAIASGTQSVTFADGRQITYRSIPALKEAKAMIVRELKAAEGRRPPRAYRVNVSKGV